MNNFNKGTADVFTSLPNNANGRFAELGWVQSFITKGRYVKYIKWDFYG